MTATATDLHHVGIIGADMDTLSDAFERLGFTLTPVSLPRIPLAPDGEPRPLGAGNRTAVFDTSYLELLAVVDPEQWAAVPPALRGAFDIDPPLRRYPGLHVLHLASDDLPALAERLTGLGVPHGGVRSYQRPVDTPSGPAMMRAQALALPPEDSPEALAQIAQHLTPELVLQARHQRHPNGARHLRDIVICTEQPTGTVERWGLWAGRPVSGTDGVARVDLGPAAVVVTTPETLPRVLPGVTPPDLPSLVGITVDVDDLVRTTRLLHARDVPTTNLPDAVIVDPVLAGGCAIVFRQSTDHGSVAR